MAHYAIRTFSTSPDPYVLHSPCGCAGGLEQKQDRTKRLSWSCGRDVATCFTSMEHFDEMGFDSDGNTGHRIERPIGGRYPKTFVLNKEWFENDYVTR